MKKLPILLTFLLFTNWIYSQENVSAFAIIFGGKSDKITEQNIDQVYSLVLQIDKMLKDEKSETPKYSDSYKIVIDKSRFDEIDEILSSMKDSLKTNITERDNKYNLIISSVITASNKSALDKSNYSIEILDSDLSISNANPRISMGGTFDFSMNNSIKKVYSKLEYNYKLSEKPKSKESIKLNLKAVNGFEYKVLSKKNIQEQITFNYDYKLINLTNTHACIETNSNEKLVVYPYKAENIAKYGGVQNMKIYKSLYNYLAFNENITKDKLANEFPIEKMKNMNKEGYYKVIIPDTKIENEIILFDKSYKSITVSEQIKL